MTDPAARARLDRWKLSLLDLSTANRLLDAKPDLRTQIPLPGVDPVRVAQLLAAGTALAFDPAGDARSAGGIEAGRLRVELPAHELLRRLTAIRRAARAQLADAGVHTLWLALGLLHWCDADGATRAAPLWLVPVELERADDGLRLVAVESIEPRFNLTLGEKLRRDLDVVLAPPAVGEGGDDDAAARDPRQSLAGLLEAAEGIAVTRPGWRVERAAQLGVFSFAKFTMWTDLDARAEALLAAPVVAHLAAGTGIAFGQPSGAAAGAVTAAPGAASLAFGGELLAPLDADASQLAAVAAAGAGASFVLQGPPGTGKSQTIANLIVHCVSQGKSVLFVTDKIAALEVVQQRLAAVGLSEFCLELHSHKAGRAHVVGQLARVLERSFRPGGPTGDDGRLIELRNALDAYAAALHRVGSFGRSLHAVLGRLVELRGTPRAPLAESDATGLDGAMFERRRHAIEALAAAAVPIEPVATHPWRRSQLERLPLDGRERALAALDEAAAAAGALSTALRDVAALVPGLAARTRDQLVGLGTLAAVAAVSPRPGAELLTQLRPSRGDELGEQIALLRAKGAGAIEVPRDPLSFLLLANRHRGLASEVAARFTDRFTELAALDAHQAWSQLKKWSGSVAPVRFVTLRTVRAEVRAFAIPGQLETDAELIGALEAVLAERACRAALAAAAEPARRWFGELGGDPLGLDLGKLDAAVGWAADLRRAFDATEVAGGDSVRTAAWRALVAQVAAGGGPTDLAPFARLADAVARWRPALFALAEELGIEQAELGAGDGDHLAVLREQVEGWRDAIGSLRDWIAFHAARRAALSVGAAPAVAAIERGDLGAAELAPAWERATLLAWADAELAEAPALARFHGPTHHAHVSAFADLDRGALALVRSRALARLAERLPRVVDSAPGGADPGGELGLLLHELKKQRGHRPLRRLFAEVPSLLPRLAPCMLMSPLSVAQYLDPAPAHGEPARFDVVVFDEASQLPTADAIGALARGASAVVVGDSRQLPPTRFFEASAAGPGDDADPEVGVELESVLDDCVAARLPELRLAWHYRSKHEDLIAFANRAYYGDRLQVFPTAHGSPDLGISWRHVEGAAYDRGGTRTNRGEAEAVVAEVVARLKDPAQCMRSIAVVAFSRAQQELIEDLLDTARATDSALDAVLELIGAGAHAMTEPVIVKNLETVQGDERDVVLLSVGYGPDAQGSLALNFGPLSQRGGERRLNVAITRAREQLVVFSSFAPEAIPDDAPRTLRDLADLLAFARAGGGAAQPSDDLAPASPIADAIARALTERGWTLRHQVGCGAYKVDLAVVDPNDPSRYVLAIEHDGTAYASAPAARDRDRLRGQVLSALGWRQHRIWSLDWWADPEREIQRAHAAIVTALAASRQRRSAPGAAAGAGAVAAGAGSGRIFAPGGSAGSGRTRTTTGTSGLFGAGGGAAGSRPNPMRPKRPSGPSPYAAAARGVIGEGSAPAAVAGAAAASGVGAEGVEGVAHDGPTAATAVGGDLLAAGSRPNGDAPDAALAAGLDTSPVKLSRGAIAIGPYVVAAIPAGRRIPDDLFAARHLPELGKVVEQVLAAEAPMHVDLLARRVGAYFGIGRVTQRVADQIRLALDGRGRWGDETDMVWRIDQDPAQVPGVRVAGNVAAARRDITEVPLSEVAAAVRIVVERAIGIGSGDLVRDTARLLGFARITEKVTARVGVGLRLAAARKMIRIDGNRATLPD